MSGKRRIITHLGLLAQLARALRLHRRCHRFKSDTVHHLSGYGVVVTRALWEGESSVRF